MREILFKAKSINNGGWVEGYYAELGSGSRVKHYIIQNGALTRLFDDSESNMHFIDVEVDPSTVCQYTGLTDKNGKKIWENDIICNHYDSLYPEDETMLLIAWDKFGWKIKEGSSSEEISIANDIENCEVVGNIFDNPELLQED